MMKTCYKGGIKMPAPQPAPATPDANEEAKAAAAAAKVNAQRRNKTGMNNTLAGSPEGVLGAAPTNKPALKGTLG